MLCGFEYPLFEFIGIKHAVEIAGFPGRFGIKNLGQCCCPVEEARREPVTCQLDTDNRDRHADRHLVESDLEGASDSDTVIGSKQYHCSGRQRVSGTGRDERAGKILDSQEQFRTGPNQTTEGLGPVIHDGKIKAGGKAACSAFKNQNPGRVFLGLVQGAVKPRDHPVGKGIDLGVVHAYEGNTLLEFIADIFRHFILPPDGLEYTENRHGRKYS